METKCLFLTNGSIVGCVALLHIVAFIYVLRRGGEEERIREEDKGEGEKGEKVERRREGS